VRSGARASVLGGRRFERASELAAALGGRAAPFEALRDEMSRAEIVISGTGAPGLVIDRADVEAASAARGQRPLFLIDIAVPRDIDPEAARVPGVFLYDLDDLKAVGEANLRERRKEAAAAEAIVEREVVDFLAWRKSLDVVPVVVELRQRAEEIRKSELQKARSRLGSLTAEQESAIEGLTSAIVNKLIHPPTVHLKEIASNGHAPEQVGFIRKLFGL
jgi:glutamyl-tRNA reductase